jgi:hypothetical protein
MTPFLLSTFPMLRGALLLSVPLIAHGTPSQQPIEASARHSAVVEQPLLLPRAIASFGACRAGGWLYVYGGHIGRAHAHSRENVIGTFARLNLFDGTWQELPAGPAQQGTALVAGPDGSIYRIGGMTAANAADADADLHSSASVARFDPVRSTWIECTPLPEPRSSHDAVVHDGRIYVVGGWALAGGDDGTFHETAWVSELGDTLCWRPLPPPKQRRRAAALAAVDGAIVLLGGIDEREPLHGVEVFHLATGEWHSAPDLPGFAFGTAAMGHGDRVFATVFDGRLLSLRPAAAEMGLTWCTEAQLATPRFFHRLVADVRDHGVLAIGGAGRKVHLRTIERLRLDGPSAERGAAVAATITQFVLPAPSAVANRQSLVLQGDALWAIGGNRGRSGDRFAADQFVDEIWHVDLADMTARLAGRLPTARQSMTTVTFGTRGEVLLLGGLGPTATGVTTSDETLLFEPRRNSCTVLPSPLPTPRTQSAAVVRDGLVYVLGGLDFLPDDGGGSASPPTRDVLVFDPKDPARGFGPAAFRLPRPRRSFGAAMLGDRLILVGGLGDGFEPVSVADVYDFTSGTWREVACPAAWVSPEVAVIGERLYVACGGTMDGRRFTPEATLYSYGHDLGFTAVTELPFATRHTRMLARGNRLLFYAASPDDGGSIVLRFLEPDRSVHVLGAATPH